MGHIFGAVLPAIDILFTPHFLTCPSRNGKDIWAIYLGRFFPRLILLLPCPSRNGKDIWAISLGRFFPRLILLLQCPSRNGKDIWAISLELFFPRLIFYSHLISLRVLRATVRIYGPHLGALLPAIDILFTPHFLTCPSRNGKDIWATFLGRFFPRLILLLPCPSRNGKDIWATSLGTILPAIDFLLTHHLFPCPSRNGKDI